MQNKIPENDIDSILSVFDEETINKLFHKAGILAFLYGLNKISTEGVKYDFASNLGTSTFGGDNDNRGESIIDDISDDDLEKKAIQYEVAILSAYQPEVYEIMRSEIKDPNNNSIKYKIEDLDENDYEFIKLSLEDKDHVLELLEDVEDDDYDEILDSYPNWNKEKLKAKKNIWYSLMEEEKAVCEYIKKGGTLNKAYDEDSNFISELKDMSLENKEAEKKSLEQELNEIETEEKNINYLSEENENRKKSIKIRLSLLEKENNNSNCSDKNRVKNLNKNYKRELDEEYNKFKEKVILKYISSKNFESKNTINKFLLKFSKVWKDKKYTENLFGVKIKKINSGIKSKADKYCRGTKGGYHEHLLASFYIKYLTEEKWERERAMLTLLIRQLVQKTDRIIVKHGDSGEVTHKIACGGDLTPEQKQNSDFMKCVNYIKTAFHDNLRNAIYDSNSIVEILNNIKKVIYGKESWLTDKSKKDFYENFCKVLKGVNVKQ